MAKLSPTELTLRKLRDAGYKTVDVVEHWKPHARIRKDLFGVIDVLAVGKGHTLAVQCTTRDHVSDRVKKMESDDCAQAMADMREAGWFVLVYGWYKKKNRWQCRAVDIS